jgi:hypothetical protein
MDAIAKRPEIAENALGGPSKHAILVEVRLQYEART